MALNSGTQLEGNPISAVILYGDDDLSTSMEECLYSDDEIMEVISHYTVVKLHKNSENGKKFINDFHVTGIPSLYFVSKQVVLGTLNGFFDIDMLKSKVVEVQEKWNMEFEDKNLTKDEIQEQVKALKMKIKARKEELKRNAELDEVEREKKRREEGKKHAQLQNKMRDEKEKREQRASEIEKRKMREYDVQLREQVRRERAERLKLMEEKKREKEENLAPTPLTTSQMTAEIHSSSSNQNVKITIIRIRHQEESVQSTFNVHDTIKDVFSFVESNRDKLQLPKSFGLMLPYPAYLFTYKDNTRTLKDAGLLPNASLNVMETQSNDVSTRLSNWASRVTQSFWSLFSSESKEEKEPSMSSNGYSPVPTDQKDDDKNHNYWNGNSTEFGSR